MIYLASPYSHEYEDVRAHRAELAALAAAILTKREKRFVYSPIVHGHAISAAKRLPKSWEFWRSISYDAIRKSDAIAFLLLDGWQNSVGMATEHAWANRWRIDKTFYSLAANRQDPRLTKIAVPPFQGLNFHAEPSH